ncbi:DUF5996 family protein [Sulfitobacter dubius]|uniref:DUF5996 family protein n=1 Tax=Sulfitobacter dubius TaxID=218673 RepID=UPI003C6FD578
MNTAHYKRGGRQRQPQPDNQRHAPFQADEQRRRGQQHCANHPTPEGFADHPVKPEGAYFDNDLGEFLLPYKAIQSSDDPRGTLMAFLQTTYEAAAETGDWDRGALECGLGQPRVPRPLHRG